MEYFNNFSSLSELKLIYRRLAMLNHPDMSGNAEVMKKINIEFKQTKDKIENRSNSFNNLTIGNNVIINGSHSIIVSTTDTTFTAKSDYTNRMAEFSKETGICITNPKFKARIPKFINHAN